jgi:bacterial/archaeal transporter family protein
VFFQVLTPGTRSKTLASMNGLLESWQFWAVLSAVFAAMTAVLAKVGVATVNPDMATFVRTIIIIVLLGVLVVMNEQWQNPSEISGSAYLFLGLSGLATGASWICYFRALKIGDAARVAPIDKLSVVFVAILAAVLLGERLSAPAWAGVVLISVGAALIAIY